MVKQILNNVKNDEIMLKLKCAIIIKGKSKQEQINLNQYSLN
jgi:hypothetical protein